MTFQLWHLLIPYGLFVFLFVVFAGIDVIHMVKFGTYTLANYFALVAFLSGTAFIFWATSQLLASVDWSLPVTGMMDAGAIFGNSPIDL